MDSLIVQDFRAFSASHRFKVRPVTLLVGENSSGKTSFLAAARIAEALRNPFRSPDFNEEPFSLGSFDEIANYRAGKAGRANSFWLGAGFEAPRGDYFKLSSYYYKIEYIKENGRPTPNRIEMSHKQFSVKFEKDKESWRVEIKTPLNSIVRRFNDKRSFLDVENTIYDPMYMLHHIMWDYSKNAKKVQFSTEEQRVLIPLMQMSGVGQLPYAAAPIRAQPERIYQLLNEAYRPQGEHVPILLAQLFGHKEWENIRQPLEEFARASGLFEEISVKRLGKSESSPFQVQVKLGGPPRNLVDVGYGVSQILPVLVDLLRDKDPRLFLIQQPEVHLHPRAQAELGSLFVRIAQSHFKQLIIETHSDFILDRIRTEVKNKRIPCEDVLILYFERDRSYIRVHEIEFDDRGNLVGIPDSYRSFFMEEERKFLGL